MELRATKRQVFSSWFLFDSIKEEEKYLLTEIAAKVVCSDAYVESFKNLETKSNNVDG